MLWNVLFLFWKIFPTFLKTFSLSKHFAKSRFLLAVAISSWDVIGLLPLVGSQRCPARVYDKTFQSFGDKTTLSKSFDSSFSQSNVGNFRHVSTSCGLSKRRISAVFSCFDQSLILLAASITRSQTILLLFTPQEESIFLVELLFPWPQSLDESTFVGESIIIFM